mmetsp:Transcript_148379/g.259333  ORF Transcript_148379/g.259333 Transcript_148379/m.259333 type:complete len:100 (-) Transcript_148379:6-305(-)
MISIAALHFFWGELNRRCSIPISYRPSCASSCKHLTQDGCMRLRASTCMCVDGNKRGWEKVAWRAWLQLLQLQQKVCMGVPRQQATEGLREWANEPGHA